LARKFADDVKEAMVKKPEYVEQSKQSEASSQQRANVDNSNLNNQNTAQNSRNSVIQEDVNTSESQNESIMVDHNFKKLNKKSKSLDFFV
jgi:hypothetical protein